MLEDSANGIMEVRMKLVRRISFLLVLSGVMLGLGGYGALKAEEFFYPNKYHNRDKHVQTPKVTNTAHISRPKVCISHFP